VWAILSDIHANLAALEAVLADAEREGANEFVNLGDTLGYGPSPVECLRLVMERAGLCLLGNHDQAVLFEPDGFGASAERAVLFNRRALQQAPDADRLLEYLGALPRQLEYPGVRLVHGSPRSPLNEYVFPEDIYNDRKISRVFALIERCCFCGHTHLPGVFEEADRAAGEYSYQTAEELNGVYHLSARKALVNVGSVGQPRDGDPRACYVLFDGETARFRRVDYDVDATVRLIHDLPDLDDFLGDRLPEGR
jgi:diadenosine tetraphosphatase ApaH/serine/threonine PP2A family protein phosphatase